MSNTSSFQRPPKYRKHKATGQATVTIGGRDFYLGKHNSAASHEEYRRLVAEWLQNGGCPGANRQQEITVVEIVAAYTKYARGYYRKNGEPTREYEKVVEVGRHIKRLYGRSRVVEFGPLALKAVRQSMVDAGNSRKFINKNIERARRVFKWAAGEELISHAVPQALSMVTGLKKGRTEARETKPVMPVDDSAVDATLAHLPDVVADMVRLQRLTAMRPCELCIVRPCDIDRSQDVWLYRPGSHKTEHHGRERVVFIGPQAQGVLLRYLARDAKAFCFRPCESEEKRLAERHANRKTPLSCGNTPGSNRVRKPKRSAGDCYTTDTYRRAVYRACDKAEIERWSPGRLRHTAATEIRKRFGLEGSQVALGHASAVVTEIYAERDLQKGVEIAAKIG